ncbi:pentapeptide repeat-containing protein [Nocardia sp. CDC160]|uniref:pentapeptide repeat-containing protein n=1 Tax=Nocardia sp. CDC160 TaxID=3112166 RepID=UPI002DBC5C9A|nr:pentapeptide repeat-containing protein [Nocardia sp. CDC160]MEC3914815.1 pentapeptide repeat-containing protein [Nocardia sp. CDC160]
MRRWRFGGVVSRTVHRSGLMWSVLAAVVGGLAIAGLTWWGLWHFLGVTAETPNRLDLGKVSLAVTAGVGGAVALVVAYRRQRDSERGRFADVFGAAARQLGDPDVAVRIAGVYAMAGVADEFSSRWRRQQCVDVLCGYLRLPYHPEEGNSHLVSKTQRIEDHGTAVERVFTYRQNDRQVRDTIVRVIAEHLRRTAETSWSACDFDFSDAVFEDVDFRHAVFAGRTVRFTNTQFLSGRTVSFEQARFLGGEVTFQGAMFRTPASFDRAVFAHTAVDKTDRAGARTVFTEATFGGGVSFEGAQFQGARTAFDRTTFAGERASFANAAFAATLTSFERAVFDGERVTFTGAEFTGARVTFADSRFYTESSSFDCAQLGAQVRWRTGRTQEVTFVRAEYHGRVSFADAVFSGRSVSFANGDFFGDISFRRAAFDARAVSFERPKAWVGVHFDWEASPNTKPANITPTMWPPVLAESETVKDPAA